MPGGCLAAWSGAILAVAGPYTRRDFGGQSGAETCKSTVKT
jgi:hypothetical protein